MKHSQCYPYSEVNETGAMQTNLEALIEAAKHLSDEERKTLVEALHPCSDSPQPRHITEMRGLGKDLWQGIDPQDYLNAERDSWNNLTPLIAGKLVALSLKEEFG